MKKAKYITGAVLLFVVLVLAGEVYVWHASSFSYSGYTSFLMYLQEGDTQENMLAGIESAARETGVEVFCVDMIVDSLFSMRVNVYATPGVRGALAEKSQIREGIFESPLVGRIQIEIFPFAETPDISKLSFANEFYIIGSEESIMDFRRATIDDYAGNFPHGFPDGHDSKKIFIAVPWVIVVILMTLLTQFEIELLKKEVVVRLITGESVGRIILKNIAADILFFAALTAALLAVLRGFTNALYAVDVTLCAMGIYLIGNSLSFLRLFFVDFRRDMATKAGAKKTIRAAYVFKIITAVLAVAVLSVNIELAVGAVNFYRQREFFENRSRYSHLIIHVYAVTDDSSAATEGVVARLYALTLERGTSEMLAWIDGYQYDGGYVFANKGAAEYLQTEIPELRELVTEEKVYFIVPEKLSRRDDVLDDMKQSWELYYREEYKDEILTYKGNPNIVAVTQGNKVSSTFVNQPLIVLNNMGADSADGYRSIGYLYQATMFKLTPEEVDAYQTELGYPDVPPHMTNVLENYRYQWQFEKRTLLIAAVLMALILMLEGIVLMTILRFEYRVYATELALKKVLGHTLYDRNRRIVLTTAITGLIGLIASLVVCRILGTAPLGSVALGGVALLALELVFAMANAVRIEKRNISRILKGESV